MIIIIELYVDGASAGNPGKSGIGIFLKGEGHHLQLAEKIEPTDNHSAEFQALIRGLEEAAKRTTGIVSARSDSQLVVQAVDNQFVKNPLYKTYLAEILKLTEGFEYFFIKWIPTDQNRAADALAKKAIYEQVKKNK